MLIFDTVPNADTGDYILFSVLFLFMVGLLFGMFVFSLKSLRATDIYTVDGVITKSMRPRYYRSPAVYKIHLNGKDFRTEKYLWSEMLEGSDYRLWYAVIGRLKKVIGFEKMSEPQFVDLPMSLAKEEAHPRRLTEKPLPATVKKNYSPQIQRLKQQRKAKRSKLRESH
ncbi:MAG: hypothetical protein V9G20_00610 [Candidatus Promineifilaceae bacterium]